jgi:hypothetical protein
VGNDYGLEQTKAGTFAKVGGRENDAQVSLPGNVTFFLQSLSMSYQLCLLIVHLALWLALSLKLFL